MIAVTLELLVEFTRASPAVGEALVPYYRQLLPRLNALKDVDDVYVSLARLADARSWRERPPRANAGEDENDEDPPRPVTPPNETEREDRLARRAQELAKTKQQLDTTAWALVFAIVAITIKRLVVQQVIGALQ